MRMHNNAKLRKLCPYLALSELQVLIKIGEVSDIEEKEENLVCWTTFCILTFFDVQNIEKRRF